MVHYIGVTGEPAPTTRKGMIQMETANLETAYAGSYYTILGAGGDLSQWTNGYKQNLQAAGIGTPASWYTTTGQAINDFAATKGDVIAPFPADLTVLMFPLDGLAAGALAIFKLQYNDRWLDDIVNNMVAGTTDDEYDEEGM